MDRFDAISILIEAVDAGSLSEASRRLRMPLATVSRKVSELEAHLGASLLVRSARGLTLTPTGRAFVGAAQSILEQLNEAKRAAAGEYVAPRGDLVVTAPVMFGRLHVLPVITEFLDAYPEVDVDLSLSDRVAHLIDDHVDVALRIGDLPDSNLVATRLGAVRRVVCASPDYLAAHGRPGRVEDLSHHTVVTFDGVASHSSWRFGPPSAPRDVTVRARLGVNDIMAAVDAALAGAGLARVVSYQVVEHLRRGALELVLAADEPPPRPVHLIYNGASRLPLKLRAFVDFVTPRLRRRLAEAEILRSPASDPIEPWRPRKT